MGYIYKRDKEFVKRENPKDRRYVEYFVSLRNNPDGEWKAKKEVIELILDGDITNAYLSGNKIVDLSEVKVQLLKITESNLEIINKEYKKVVKLAESSGYDCYYEDIAYFNNAQKNNFKRLLKNGYMTVVNKELCCLFEINKEKTLNITMITVPYCKNRNHVLKKAVLDTSIEISKKIKDSVLNFYDGWYIDYEAYINRGFKELKNDCSFSENKFSWRRNLYLTLYDENMFSKAVEKKYFKKITDISKIEYKEISQDELNQYYYEKYIKRYGIYEGWWCNSGNIHLAAGFNYFRYNEENSNNERKYIVAIYEGNLVGVIYYGYWGGNKSSQGLSYIDVSKPYRGLGIATNMIKELDKHLDKVPLELSEESDMGKKVHMNELFKKYIKSTRVITSRELRGY